MKVLLSELKSGDVFAHPTFKLEDGITPEKCVVVNVGNFFKVPDGNVTVVYLADGLLNWMNQAIKVEKLT